MRYYFLIISAAVLALINSVDEACGQDFNTSGGRASGMAGSSILLHDEYGLFNNPGSVQANNLTFLAAYSTKYLPIGINDVRIGMVLPLAKITTGLGVLYFGDELFNQIRVSSLIADNFGFASVALRANYHQFYVKNYGYRRALTFDIGGLFSLSEQLSFAMVFRNISRSKLLGETDNPLSSIIQMGLSYQPIEKFRMDAQLNKSITQATDLRFGIEYKVTESISVRSGFSPSSTLAAMGLGIFLKTIILDFAGSYHQQLGYSGIISLKIMRTKP